MLSAVISHAGCFASFYHLGHGIHHGVNCRSASNIQLALASYPGLFNNWYTFAVRDEYSSVFLAVREALMTVLYRLFLKL